MVCLALTALPCQALDFGRTNVNSALGEPLDAHVRIRLESGEHIDDSCLSVGNQDDFPDSDHVLITDARLSLLTSRNAIRISTTKPLTLPAVSMALRVRCANGLLTVRALNLYLNPPTEDYFTDIASSLPGTSITVQPGDSVYGLARTIFPRSEKAVRELALAIVVANPALFPDERPRPLKIGERLTIPDLRTVQRIVADSGISPVTGLPLEPQEAKPESSEPQEAKPQPQEPATTAAKMQPAGPLTVTTLSPEPEPQSAMPQTPDPQPVKSETATSRKAVQTDPAVSNVSAGRTKPGAVRSGKIRSAPASSARAAGALQLKLALSIDLTPSKGMTEARRAVLRQGLRPAVAIKSTPKPDPQLSGLSVRLTKVREAQHGINAQIERLDLKVAVLQKSVVARNQSARPSLPTAQAATPAEVSPRAEAASKSPSTSTWWQISTWRQKLPSWQPSTWLQKLPGWQTSTWWRWPTAAGVALLLVAGFVFRSKFQMSPTGVNDQERISSILANARVAAAPLLGSEPASQDRDETVHAPTESNSTYRSQFSNNASSTSGDVEPSFERAAVETVIDPPIYIPAAGDSSSSSMPSPYPDIIDPSSHGDVTQELQREMDDALDGARSMFTDVDRFIAVGRTQNALSLLEFQIKSDPTDRDAWVKLMAIYKQEGMDDEFESAHAAFDKQFKDG